MKVRWIMIAPMLLLACDGPAPLVDGGTDAGPPGPTAAVVDYAAGTLFDAPWPDERLRGDDGKIALSDFPNPRGVGIVSQMVEILSEANGFAVSSTIYFPLTGGVDEASLPSLADSAAAGASVFIMDVEPGSASLGTYWPVDVVFIEDGGDLGADHSIAVLPLQGRPLLPEHLYVAVLTTSVRGVDGTPLGVAPGTAALLQGEQPTGLSAAAFEAHTTALAGLRGAGIADASIASTAVFRTWDPAAELIAAYEQVRALSPPAIETPMTLVETFDEFCVYESTLPMPDFQAGVAPYLEEGGAWERDGDGNLVLQRTASARFYVTVPRASMPTAGLPAVVFSRTGGGGDRPLIDRGPRSVAGGEADEPGHGPAIHFARAGYAGVQVDGPLGGLRNLTGWDEQFAVFNIANPRGLRDNIRQSALELALVPHVLDGLAFDGSECAGFSSDDGLVRFNVRQMALMGHSMGATITPLTAAIEPMYSALILSGAGGSWIENVMFKRSPLQVRPLAEAILLYTSQGRMLTEHDPALALLQWAGESADPQVYARWLSSTPRFGEARNILMFQGILDTYIPPPIANALSLSFDLDLAGGSLDEAVADRYPTLAPLFAFTSGQSVELPISGNRTDGTTTAVVVQHEEDGIEDGHEVAFQAPLPGFQYECFLKTMGRSAPVVVSRDATACPIFPGR